MSTQYSCFATVARKCIITPKKDSGIFEAPAYEINEKVQNQMPQAANQYDSNF